MPRFEPFAGVRYDLARVDLDDVVAPPYDVIGPEDQAALEARSPYNVVRIDLAREQNGRDRYTTAGCLFDEWLATGILRTDPEPGFYAYRMGYHDPEGHSRQIVGVVGALEVVAPGEGDVLPHEETQHKVRDDRLKLLKACRADLSPVWGLSTAEGLTELATGATGAPVARCTDEDGVHHRLWRLTQPGVVEAVAETVASAPVVIADGHHRYATALAHRNEVRAADGGGGDEDLLLALVCELTDGQASVRPIHRLIAGLSDGFDLVAALEPFFEPLAADPPVTTLPDRMAEAGGLGLVLGPDRLWLLVPRAGAGADGGGGGDPPPDASLLDHALGGLPAHTLAFDHSLDSVCATLASGHASAGVLLRPVDVRQIADTARAGRRMPTKTTFFHPKPRTGMVFRRLSV
ncbi:MAG: DUF1015 family protein [Acidimicrobiales bacterium]